MTLGIKTVNEANPLTDEAACGWPGQPMIVIEINIMRIVCAGWMRRKMHRVMVRLGLVVCRDNRRISRRHLRHGF